MNKINKYRNKIFLILLICLFSTAATVYFVLKQKTKQPEKQDLPIAICGNTLENKSQRSEVFNAYCAACHQKTNLLVGPALQQTDSTILWHWLNGKNKEIDTSKLVEMGIDYHRKIGSESLDSSHLNQILLYLNN